MIKKTLILYFSQIYRAILPLVFIPLILSILGTERYGMLAFYYMLVGFLGLLDAGVSGTFLKLIATNKNNYDNFKKVTILFFKVLILFSIVGLLVQLFFLVKSDLIVSSWLNTKISYNESIYAVKAIGIVLALLYIKSYLVSFLNGMEKQEIVAIWNIVYGTIFYLGGFSVIKYIDNSLYSFFDLMKALAILDITIIFSCIIFIYLKHSKKIQKINNIINNSDITFKKIFSFSIQLSGLSIIWVIATQIDKLVLSSFIPLAEYSKYQIAVQLSSVVAIFSAPISQLLLPRLSRLYTDKEKNKYTALYCKALLIFIIVLSPIGPYFFYFGENLITLWMSNTELGININSYAKWLVSAAFLATTMNFIFILLYTTNQLKHHFYAYSTYSLFTIPISIYVAKNFGGLASAKFVFIHTLLFMLLWSSWQLKTKFHNLLLKVSIYFSSIILISILNFKILSFLLKRFDIEYIQVLAPPIINLLLLMFLVFLFRKRINLALTNITFRS
ncbi:oligosaccharide flippase family protein [Providencia rettgeri]